MTPAARLPDALRGELAAGPGIVPRILARLGRKRPDAPPRRLYAVIEMGRVPGRMRPWLDPQKWACRFTPLLGGAPHHAALAPHGPMLVSHSSAEALLGRFGGCDSDIVSAWAVSRLATDALAAHFRHAASAQGPDGARYLFRWYDPLITPVALRVADPAWAAWLLAPLSAWWYPADTPKGEAWKRAKGGGRPEAPPPVPLRLGEEAWEALVRDPLPYQILNFAEENIPDAFGKKDCYGVKAAKVEMMLGAAKSQGIRSREDLTAYVTALLTDPARVREPRWQAAVAAAARNGTPLAQYFSTQT